MRSYFVTLVVDTGAEPEHDERVHFAITAINKREALAEAKLRLASTEPEKARNVWCWMVGPVMTRSIDLAV